MVRLDIHIDKTNKSENCDTSNVCPTVCAFENNLKFRLWCHVFMLNDVFLQYNILYVYSICQKYTWVSMLHRTVNEWSRNVYNTCTHAHAGKMCMNTCTYSYTPHCIKHTSHPAQTLKLNIEYISSKLLS